MSEIENAINANLNAKGKLDCSKAFKISAKLKVPIREVGDTAHKLDIRIDSCELGQFGKLEKGDFSGEAKERLLRVCGDAKKITCKDARDCAAGVGLKAIRSVLDKENIDVTYCELGCFSEKKRLKMKIKTKTWIENSEGQLLFGKGKTEILEAIKQEKSISAAADKVGMNYKKAWSHVQILQKYLDKTLVSTHKGGGEQGGSFLTKEAEEYIEKYKLLQNDIEEFANKRFRELFLKR